MVLDHLQCWGSRETHLGPGEGLELAADIVPARWRLLAQFDARVRVWAPEAWRALPHRLAGRLTRCSSAVADNGADPDEGSRPAPARTTTWKHAHCWLLK